MAVGEIVRRFLVDTRPLRVPAYRRLWLGQVVSSVGVSVTVVAVSQHVWELTHSSFWVGMLGLANLLPLLLFGLWGGAFADAVDRRGLLLTGSLVAWASVLAILLIALFDVASVPLLLGAVAVGATGFAISSPTRGAIIPRLLPAELVPAANALNSLGMMGVVVGPMIGGVALALSGYAAAYAVDFVLFGASVYAALRLPALPPRGRVARPGARAVLAGLRFIATTPILLMSFVVDIIAMVFALPRALFPEVVEARFGGSAIALGWLTSAMAIGTVAGGLFSGWVGRVRRQGLALTVVIALWGVAVALAGVVDDLWLVVLFMALGGAADMASAVWRQSILQTYAPDEMRGRMQGVFMVVVAGGPRLGDLRAGATGAAFGLSAAWVGGGVACALAVLAVGLAVPAFRNYRPRAAGG